jgi:type IV secretory pathway VirJ component
MRLSGAMLALVLTAAQVPALAQTIGSVDLPKGTVVEYRAGEGANRDLAIVLSGDGGWADLDRQLGNILVGRGTSVIGFDCMKYFWQTRSPDETARDVNATLATYLKAWDKDRLILVGYSFGAAVLPFILARLPDELKPKVALAVMLGSAPYANWEIHWGDWLHDQPHASARPVGPELAKVQGVKLLCIYGADEAKQSVCPSLAANKAEILELSGGHHFDGNYVALADLILRRVPR